MDNMEAIGNVVLNYKYYSGEDLYSEGLSEDLLLKYVSENSEADYPHVIQNTRSWPVLYHLSTARENICSWLPIKKSDKVLEIGSGCGAITGCLSRLAGRVTCIELSKKRSTINAVRHKQLSNIEIMVGNFEDIEPELTEKYDYITLIGVLEYAGSYINSPDPYNDILKRVSRHLNENGRLIIAIENRMGLKYFAGCKEDHTGRLFEGIEGYPETTGVKTFTRKELKQLLDDCGYHSRFYYPYPDYKLPHTIYSDSWLPGTGELNTNMRNFDADRVVTFDETRVFDTLIKEDRFADFSNSFLVMATVDSEDSGTVLPVYAKYSGERANGYRIATIIEADGNGGSRAVYKQALSLEANAHVDSIFVKYKNLTKDFEGTGFAANACKRVGDEQEYPVADNGDEEKTGQVALEFLEGITLEAYLDRLEEDREYERMLLLMKQYEAMINSISRVPFKNSESFSEVFGCDIEEDYMSPEVPDIDMIFTNIVFDEAKKENGVWTVLDYEWTFNFPVPSKFIVYRTLFYYIDTHKGSPYMRYIKKRGLDLYAEFKITEAEKELFSKMEKHFQEYIVKGSPSLEVIYKLMPVKSVDMNKAAANEFYFRNLNNPEIFYSSDGCYSSDKRIYRTADTEDADGHNVSIEIPVEDGMDFLRFDPAEFRCLVRIREITLIREGGEKEKIESFLINGMEGPDGMLLFDTQDPQLHFIRLPRGKKIIRIKYTVSMPEEEIFDMLKGMFRERTGASERLSGIGSKVLHRLERGRREVLPAGLRRVVLQ
jgi:precorrin-6B methylase 2